MWSRNQQWYGGVGVLVKEGLHDKVIEVRRENDRVMSLAIVFEDVLSSMCICSTKWKINRRKRIF